jgi:signal transduction histidine kinase
LTVLYGALFLAAGAVLLAITYGLVANSIAGAPSDKNVVISRQGPSAKIGLPALPVPRSDAGVFYSQQGPAGKLTVQVRGYAGKLKQAAIAKIERLTAAQRRQLDAFARRARAQLAAQRSATLDSLLTKSGIALAIMAFVSIGLGWLMAGRALRPVRTMAARARGISERNLHERLGVEGPNDELKELGQTFDGLLGRLEEAFESQRRFVANASHELRTPITVERTLVEVALADPDADEDALRATCERVLAAGEQQERLIEALLTLARSQRGLAAREELDLGTLALETVRGIPWNGVRVESSLAEAPVRGDRALLERLVGNLVDNARIHNVPDGWVKVWTGRQGEGATIRVTNSGEVVDPEAAPTLVEPFRRLNGERNGLAPGLGLGLSIVDAIAQAHDAALRTSARPDGGLEVEVRFPGAASM